MTLKVTVNPDPFTSELYVLIDGSFAANVVMRLTNSKHTVVRIATCTLKKGENNVKITNLQQYASGRYHLEVVLLNGDLVETISLVKI